jgi:predicted permease
VAEVALSLVLLAGAGLLTRSFVALQRVAPGFVPDGVMTAGLLMPIGSRFDPVAEGPRWAASFGAYIERLAAIPGVVAAGGVSSLPLSGAVETASFVVEGRPTPPGAQHPSADYAVATADYFRAIGIPLIAGRTFDARDDPSGVRVIVVSAAFARSTWPDVPVREVLGRRILLGFAADAPHAVVGVVGDVRQTGLDAAAAPAMYFPSAQMPYPFLTLVVRTTSADAAAIAPSMREALRALDAGLALHDVRPLRAVVDASIARQRFAMAVTGAFAVAALLLAAIGLYGVIAYGVAQRTREIGLRVALGAGPRQVLALVVGEGMRVTAVGVALGLAIALAGSRLLQGLLYGVQATDITVHATVVLLTLGVAFVASYLPARRAALIDPAVTLRGE